MKKLDPLYVILLSIVVLIVSIILFNSSIKKLNKSQDELKNISLIAINYSNMKNDWNDKKNTIIKIDQIIRSLKIKRIDKKITKKKIKIKIEDVSSNNLDKFINKVLNKKLNILKLDITNNSINLEVGI
ncbi:MAG: hypothetical protein HOJ96_01930 [Campylobacteraceae bacterium]|jgi:hypothetical protein|nr:hypothetical protein [Campylobacteraceae bacterium]MBT5234649.1 hypothetical protein [Candidatus Neomarinimicrobiota bacterium]MBT6388572.1 hypothetical protein [Campylobacteraceae bacterium]